MVSQPERVPAIAPGTPMWKAVPPRLVGPYLDGQRSVLAGYVYRAQDVRFHNPAEAYLALGLGWEDSEFTPVMNELFLLCWLARAVDGYQPTTGPSAGEFYLEPIPIPVGRACAGWAPRGMSWWRGTTAWRGIPRSRELCDCG